MYRKKLTKEEFIIKATFVHGNKYDYTDSIYVNQRTPIIIKCFKHGYFKTTPNRHIYSKAGCYYCGIDTIKEKLSSNAEDFIVKAKKIFPDDEYDYSLVKYINNHTKIQIKHNICGKIFEQRPNDHLSNFGCPVCANNILKTEEEFEKEVCLIHGNKYDFSLCVYKGAHKKVIMICAIHGPFKILANKLIRGGGCPVCNESKGEKEIFRYLTANNIKFQCQMKFEECKYKRRLPFDFGILDENKKVIGLIEYQGEEHYIPVKWSKNMSDKKAILNLQNLQKRDLLKKLFCNQKSVPFLEIKYSEKDNMHLILDKFMDTLK